MSSPASSGQSSRACARRQDSGRHAVVVLQLDISLEDRDVRLPAQDEQVAHLLEVDLPAGSARELPERAKAPLGDLDVQRIGELRAHPARGSAGRSAPELLPLEQHDINAGLGQVKGDARSNHAAADDHDGRGGGKRSYGTRHRAASGRALGVDEARHAKLTPWARGSSSE